MNRWLKNDALERAVTKMVVEESGCWIWIGAKSGPPNGLNGEQYGNFWTGIKPMRAHRFMYQFFIGKIPKEMVIDHLCRRPSCVNPNHMEIVTQRENSRRSLSPAGLKSQQTHCKRGHIFDDLNTRRTATGNRICRKCDSIAHINARRKARESKNDDGGNFQLTSSGLAALK